MGVCNAGCLYRLLQAKPVTYAPQHDATDTRDCWVSTMLGACVQTGLASMTATESAMHVGEGCGTRTWPVNDTHKPYLSSSPGEVHDPHDATGDGAWCSSHRCLLARCHQRSRPRCTGLSQPAARYKDCSKNVLHSKFTKFRSTRSSYV